MDNKLSFFSLKLIDQLNNFEFKYPGLFQGNMGLAIFWANAYKAFNEEKYLSKCHIFIEKVLDDIQEVELPYSFAYGLAGIIWSLKYLRQEDIISFDNNYIERVENQIYESAIVDLNNGYFDLFDGYIGKLLCLLNHKEPSMIEVSHIVKLIEAKAIRNNFNDGFYWKDGSNQVVDLGLAHGQPSLIAFLSQLIRKESFSQENLSFLKNIILKSIRGIIFYENKKCKFKYSANNKTLELNSRLAWCYGDLGVSISLASAGQVLGCSEFYSQAERIALNSLQISIGEGKLRDNSLCHGFIGSSLIYLKLAKVFENNKFLEQSNRHLELSFVQTSQILEKLEFENKDKYKSELNYSFLTGLVGVGLYYFDRLKNSSSGWSECLLIRN